jgi:hypothetical protein
MKDLSRVTDGTLEKRKAAIEFEQMKRQLERGGQDPEVFNSLHIQPDCSLETVFIQKVGSGFVHIDISPLWDYELPAYQYAVRCKKHGSQSKRFESMTPLDGAVTS